jgi:hypothetical protein
MHIGVTTFLVIWTSLSILINDCNSFVVRVYHDRDGSTDFGREIWLSWRLDKLFRGTDLEYGCVTNELWSKCVATGQTHYGDWEFEIEDGEIPEEHSRWRRSLFKQIPYRCSKGSVLVFGKRRRAWG